MKMTVTIDTAPLFELSPHMYMQFVEPLGTADSSVDAAWDYVREDWHPRVVEKLRELAPGMVRWGGCFASYYHWKEAVGPRDRRVPMLNLCWDGIYANQVGTAEIADLCDRIGADLLLTVNMESDGRRQWAYPKPGIDRLGTADEAAQWVDYCNNPDNALRKTHGRAEPYNVRYWQIGNETSYDPKGFCCEDAARVTARFAGEMRRADPDIRLIAWGDNEWAGRMCEAAGDGIDYIAFHHHYTDRDVNSPAFDLNYRRDFSGAWDCLMNAHKSLQQKIDLMRSQVLPYGKRLAMTESHFNIGGRDRNDLMSSWAAGVAYARCLNVMHRNGDVLKIATSADCFGNRWQVNALMIPTPMRPKSQPYLQPVGMVMALFGRYQGRQAVPVRGPATLDMAASRTGDTLYIHIVNTDTNAPAEVHFEIPGHRVEKMILRTIHTDPAAEITEFTRDGFDVQTHERAGNFYSFPKAGVSVAELHLTPVGESDG